MALDPSVLVRIVRRVASGSVAGFACIVAPFAFADGPFGLTAGDAVSNLPDCKQAKPGTYLCRSLPKTHPSFKYYIVMAPPKTGVCKVAASGQPIADDRYGVQVRTAVDGIAEQLRSKYGDQLKKTDELARGSIWDEPVDWLMGIKSRERVYVYQWLDETGYVPVDRVTAVGLKADASSATDGKVWVEFEFDNFQACMAEIAANEANAF